MTARVFVGTYTARESEGIYVFPFGHGRTGAVGLAARTANPSFVLAHPNGRWLYAVNELWEFEGRPGGGVSAFRREGDADRLEPLGTASSQGADPCHLALDESERFLFVSNFTSGSVAVLPLRADGSPEQASDVVEHAGRGLHPRRQAGPHVHSTLAMPGGRFVLAADLGLDEIVVYEFDRANGTLRRHGAAPARPGSGPRHLALAAGAGIVFVSNEIDSTVASYRWDAPAGELSLLAVAAAVPAAAGALSSSADIHLHPARPTVYVSNRGDDSIAVFDFELRDGGLQLAGRVPSGGAKPRGFALSPDGRWLLAANHDSDNVVVFATDLATGLPAATNAALRVPSPTCIAFATGGAASPR